eukprot:10315952-Alexandrium_andersonii.AAC.1
MLRSRSHSTFRAAWALGFSRISFLPTGRATQRFSGKAQVGIFRRRRFFGESVRRFSATAAYSAASA